VLGTGEVTPLEMAAAYATLAARGRRVVPFGVSRITGPDGRVLYQARRDVDRAVPPGVAAIAADVLREVVDHGTGVRGRIGRPAAARTGTTQDHADAWFVGFTPSLAAVVWVGYPQGQVPMVPRAPGAGSRAGPARRPSGPASCARPWPPRPTAGSRGPTPAWSR
jgi:penicillin-binding protein 1A